MKSFLKRFKLKPNILALTVITVLTLLVLLVGINRPFVGHHDGNPQTYTLAARNYLSRGVLALKFGQLLQPLNTPISPQNFYTHHPPLLSIFLAVFIGILGNHFWSIRLLPILFSVGTIALFYTLVRKFFALPTAILACYFWLGTPMFLYFGKMVDHEAPTLFFVVLAILAYVAKKQKLLFLSIFLGQWTGWPVYYLAIVLYLLTGDVRIILLSFGDFALYLAHIIVLTGSPVGGELWQILLFRMGISSTIDKVTEKYTMKDFASQEVSWLIHFFNPVQFLLAGIGVGLAFLKKKFEAKEKVAFLFLFVAFIHVLLFRTGAHRHDYWLYYFLPFFAWMSVFVADFALEKMVSRNKKVIVYLIFSALALISLLQGMPFFEALQARVEFTSSGVPL